MMHDMMEACRLCMCRDQDNMKPIYDQQSLVTKIMWISDLKMYEGDNLPAQICQQCYIRLNSAFYFKEQIIGIDRTLREMLGQDMSDTDVTMTVDKYPTSSPTKSQAEHKLVNNVKYAEEDISETECYDASNYDNIDAQDVKIEVFEHSVVEIDSEDDNSGDRAAVSKDFEVKKTIANFNASYNRKKNKSRRRDRNFYRSATHKCPICWKVYSCKAHVKRHLITHSENLTSGKTENTKKMILNPVASSNNSSSSDYTGAPGDYTITPVSAKSSSPLPTGESSKPYSVIPLTNTSIIPISNGSETTSNEYFPCHLCPKVCVKKRTLAQHMVTHFGEKPFQCSLCTRNFSTNRILLLHTKKAHPAVKTGLLCDICKGYFSSRSNLNAHQRKMHDIEVYLTPTDFRCDLCGKYYSNAGSLGKHTRRVHNSYMNGTELGSPQPFECEHCDLSFNAKPMLLSHLKTHLGEEPYFCSVCDKPFTKLFYYTEHMRNHQLDKPFKCDICLKTFYEQSSLSRHMRITHEHDSLMLVKEEVPAAEPQLDTLEVAL